MAATKTRRRRKKKTADEYVPAVRDTYHVLGPDGEIPTRPLTQTHPMFALTKAQMIALDEYREPAVLTVQRRALFGPPVDLFRVTRDEEGVVYTKTITNED